jgi:hypothetical protein
MIPVTYGQNMGGRPKNKSKSIIRAGFLSTRMIGFLFLAIMALLYIAQSTQGMTKQAESQSLRTKTEELKVEEEQLKLEAERLQSSDTLFRSAVEQLGMEETKEVDFLPNE